MRCTTFRRINSYVIIALFFSLILIPFLTRPVSAQTITPAPTSGAVGASVTITGSAFLPNVPATVFYDGLPVGNATTSSTGWFKIIFAVPSSGRGVHNIWAIDGVNNVSTTFTVTSSLTRVPTSGIVGTTIILTGYGFAPSDTVGVKWDGMTLPTSPASVTTDGNGAFVATVIAPAGEPVSHEIIANDSSESKIVAFTLTRSIVLLPNTGSTGTTVQVTGSGFLASNLITITFDNVVVPTTPATVTSDAYGGFVASFDVPSATPGAKTVRALDNVGGSATATFTVTPSITLNPVTGRGGTTVTVTGAGFTTSNMVLIKFNTAVLLNTPTDEAGGFSQAITIPYTPRGVYMFSANDTQGRTSTATFTVTPLISISPGSGPSGTYLTATGSGFTNNATVILFFGGTQLTTVPSSITTDAFGAFSASFIVPLVSTGSWSVRAQDSAGYQSTTTFSVGLNLVFSVTRGIVGTVVTVYGLGFAPISQISFTFDASVLPTTPSTIISDTLGIFQASFIVPESPGQNHLIVVNDSAGNRVSTAFTVDESISLNKSSGDVGTLVLVTGTGYRQYNYVTITFASDVVVTVPNPVLTNSNGSFNASFIIPDVSPGAKTVRASDTIGNAATTTFTVTPAISLSPATGRGGTTTTITGTGFASSSTVTIKYNGTLILTAPTDSTGWFKQAITVPLVPAGLYTIQATDTENTTATAIFTVTPTLTLSAASGIVGAVIKVTGVGFSANSNISFLFAGASLNTTPSPIISNSFGGFSCSFSVPDLPTSVWTIQAEDSSGYKIDTTFTITRRLTFSARSGAVGSNITAWGTGFEPNSQIVLTFDGFILATEPAIVMTNFRGRFDVIFSIPDSIYGYHTITAVDSLGGSVSVTFTTVTSISINPPRGNEDTIVNITGKGYADSAYVDIYFDTTLMTTNPPTVETDTFGSFSAEFIVQSETPGAHTVRATDRIGYTATATFTNTRQITLDDGNGYSLVPIKMTGAGFDSSSTISLTWDDTPFSAHPWPLTTDISGGFIAVFTVPNDTAGLHYINATDLSGHKASTTYTIVPYVSITPERLFQGDLVWITGRGFSGSSTITLTWDGVQLTTEPSVITTTLIGDFTASFRIPVNSFGYHRVVAVDQNGNLISIQYLIASSTIEVTLDVGSVYFRGEVAEFYGLISQNGQPFNASVLAANVYLPNGTMQNLSAAIAKIDTGTYRIDYVVSGNATPGTYTLVFYVYRDFGGVLSMGSELQAFQVSKTFNQMNATLDTINGTVASLSLDTGPILVKLDEINATIAALNVSSSGEVLALINTTAGTIISKLDNINAKITSVQGSVASISSSVGSIKVLLNDFSPIITGLNNSTFTIQTDLGTIEVALEDLQMRSVAIENELVRIETEVGAIIAVLENLTGLNIPVQTQNGSDNITLFTDMELLNAEYRDAEQAIYFSCNKESEDQGIVSLLISQETMNSLKVSPSEFRLFEGEQERSLTTVEMPYLYAVQTIPESLGQHQFVLYMNGGEYLFSAPLLLLAGFGLLAIIAGGFFLLVMKKWRMPTHKIKSKTMQVKKIEDFIDKKF